MGIADPCLDQGQLAELQRAGGRHIGLSLTEACPLSCAHCAAAAVPAARHPQVCLSPDLIKRFCADMPALARQGVERISLTGGEPVLALEAVAALSAAARAVGIRTTLVTGLHWAAGGGARARVIGRLPDVDSWHLSWDKFHAPQVRFESLAAAAHEIAATGADILIRVAVSDPPDQFDRTVIERVADELGMYPMTVQSVLAVGRASPAPVRGALGDGPGWPCLSTGPLVMPDGSARPCCASMMDRPNHPFAARAANEGLPALHRAWREDPLLLMIRAIGFQPLLHVLGEVAPGHDLLRDTPVHPCDLCQRMFDDRQVADRVAARFREDDLARLARAAAETVLGETIPVEPEKEMTHV